MKMMILTAAVFAAVGAECGQARLAEGGKPLAKIVIAKDADKAARFAAADLKWHLDRITGGEFEIAEEGKSKGEKGKSEELISIFVGPSGRTKTKVTALGRQQYVVDVQNDAIELVGRDLVDKGKLVYTNTEADGVGGAGWPDLFDEQGTMYAVYEFLENHCGVRWLDSTDFGTILPKDPNLSVACGSWRKEPFMYYRGGTGCEGRPDYSPTLLKGMGKSKKKSPELERYETIAYRHAKGAKLQRKLFLMRHRAGGEQAEANHSFYWYYGRFWDEDSKYFECKRPELFAKGYPGKPPQMCYTCQEFVDQSVRDIRAYFDNGGYKKGTVREAGAKWGKNAYCLEPMDNTSYCLCDGCRALTDDGPDVPKKKRQSRLWFTFVNRVAREIRKSHPDKWITTLAYADHEFVPDGVKLEDNVIVYFCILWNRMPYRDGYPEQLDRLRQWRAAYPDQPMALWLYNTFPLEIANKGKWHCFPGYFAHTAESQYRLFKELNVRHGIFHCGFDNEMENYMQLEWMQNPDRTADEMLDEYFSMYGKAAKPLRAYYDLVERRYADKSLYPKGATQQTMQIAWGSLGDAPTMAKLGALMDEATALAETEDEKRRVELFRIGVWDYMKSGFDTYCLRQATPMPMWTARVVPSADGDPDKVDWTKLPVYDMPTYTRGTTNRHETVRERIRFAHDGKFLYLEAEENADPSKLIISPKIVPVDDWELLFAGQRGQPFRYYTSGPDARILGSSFGEVNWRQGVAASESGHPSYGAVCKTDRSQKDRWTSRWAFPLDKMLDRPVKPGDTIFFNGLRVAGKAICGTAMNAGGFDVLSLVSFTSVRTPDRLGSLALERSADRADETARWQQAIDAASSRGGGEVRVGKGEHAVGCLRLKDNVTLVLEEDARLVSLPGISAFPREDGPAVVWATNAQHVAIRGKGTIDGRGADFPQVCTFNERPRLVRFDDCRDVTVEGVRLVNPARWTLFLNRCDGFAVRGVKIRAHANFNNDGIDIASRNGIVEDCDVDSYDDGIVFKALTPDTVVANVKVRNCRVSSNCAAIKFGTETFGVFRDVEISDCRVEVGADCPRWVWAKDVPDTTGEHPLCKGGLAIEMVDGGTMERITARNVSFRHVETPVFVRLNARRTQATPSKLEDVVLENLTGEAASGIACHITGIPGLRVKNVKVKDVRFSVPGGHTPAEASLPVPEREQGHPDSRMFGHRLLPAHGFYVRHADNVTFENVVFDCRKPDTRPAIVREDVK